VQSAAALAVLEVIEADGLVERAETAGGMLMEGLAKIAPEGAVVRGRGLMIGIELPAPDASALTAKALRHGLLINNATPDVLRLVPPLVITDAEIESALWGLEEVFA
jgi:acetylornithine aminotransferase